jgi:hypothetical protein
VNEIRRQVRYFLPVERSTIRRCKLLIDLPQHYIDEMLLELKKPKTEQRLTEDFFIEMERGLKTVERAMPDALPLGDKDKARQTLIKKFRTGVIDNRTHFRNLGKIARAEGVDEQTRLQALKKVFGDNRYSLDLAFNESVAELYTEKDLLSKITSLEARIEDLEPDSLDDDLRTRLSELDKKIRSLLEGTDELYVPSGSSSFHRRLHRSLPNERPWRERHQSGRADREVRYCVQTNNSRSESRKYIVAIEVQEGLDTSSFDSVILECVMMCGIRPPCPLHAFCLNEALHLCRGFAKRNFPAIPETQVHG